MKSLRGLPTLDAKNWIISEISSAAHSYLLFEDLCLATIFVYKSDGNKFKKISYVFRECVH